MKAGTATWSTPIAAPKSVERAERRSRMPGDLERPEPADVVALAAPARARRAVRLNATAALQQARRATSTAAAGDATATIAARRSPARVMTDTSNTIETSA